MLRAPLVVFVLVFAVSLIAGHPAAAQEPRGGEGLTELWEEYPLEQTPVVVPGGSAPQRPEARAGIPPVEEAPGSNTVAVAILVLAGALVLLGLAGGALRLVRARPSLEVESTGKHEH